MTAKKGFIDEDYFTPYAEVFIGNRRLTDEEHEIYWMDHFEELRQLSLMSPELREEYLKKEEEQRQKNYLNFIKKDRFFKQKNVNNILMDMILSGAEMTNDQIYYCDIFKLWDKAQNYEQNAEQNAEQNSEQIAEQSAEQNKDNIKKKRKYIRRLKNHNKLLKKQLKKKILIY